MTRAINIMAASQNYDREKDNQGLRSRVSWYFMIAALATVVITGYLGEVARDKVAIEKAYAVARAEAFQEAIEHTYKAVVLVAVDDSPESIVIEWSAGAENMLGYSRAEMVGKSIETIIPVDMKAKHRAAIAEAIEASNAGSEDPTKVQIVRCRAVAKSGVEIPVVITTRRVSKNGDEMFVAILDLAKNVQVRDLDAAQPN